MSRGGSPPLAHQGRIHRACDLVGGFRRGTCDDRTNKTCAPSSDSAAGPALPRLASLLVGARDIFKIVRIPPSRCDPQDVLARHRMPIVASGGSGGGTGDPPHSVSRGHDFCIRRRQPCGEDADRLDACADRRRRRRVGRVVRSTWVGLRGRIGSGADAPLARLALLRGGFRLADVARRVRNFATGRGIAMQAIIAIPDTHTLNQYGGPTEALMREVCGVPLLVRVIKTAVRAGADSLLVIWPSDVPQSIWLSVQAALVRDVLCGIVIVQPEAFEPRQNLNWEALSGLVDDQFLWLPWNWVTNKRVLASLKPSEVFPTDWNLPKLLNADHNARVRLSIESRPDGASVTSKRAASQAERLVVARSGKPLDGIYSTFNRWLRSEER